jgi:exonuclease III
VNVLKLLNLLEKTLTPEDGIERAKNAVGEARKMVQISFSYIDYILSLPSVKSNAEMISLTIYLTLLKQNVESNPGMVKKKLDSFSILTYNCNGLGDRKKLNRLILKVRPIVEKGGIVFLQETHITDISYCKSLWNNNLESNCVKTNSAGVITLLSKEYEIIESHRDKEGRELVLVVKNDQNKLILSNSYLPNDHKLSLPVVENIYLTLLDLQHRFPEYLTIAAGDFNVCLNNTDSINRNKSKTEVNLAESIISNNKITNLVDAYRVIHEKGGYTWKRGNCCSRLDYIFLSIP